MIPCVRTTVQRYYEGDTYDYSFEFSFTPKNQFLNRLMKPHTL
jgi:hypothetical protein